MHAFRNSSTRACRAGYRDRGVLCSELCGQIRSRRRSERPFKPAFRAKSAVRTVLKIRKPVAGHMITIETSSDFIKAYLGDKNSRYATRGFAARGQTVAPKRRWVRCRRAGVHGRLSCTCQSHRIIWRQGSSKFHPGQQHPPDRRGKTQLNQVSWMRAAKVLSVALRRPLEMLENN